MTTYYLDPSGGSNSNSGLSSGSAFLTAAHAFAVMSGGDTLRILTGTISESGLAPPSGSSGAHTIISAFDSNPVTFTGTHFDFYSNAISYVDLTGNIIFDGTAYAGTNAAGLALYQSHHITFDGVRFTQWDGTGIFIYSNSNIFRNCRNDHNGFFLDANNQVGYAWYISQNSSNNLIEHCLIDHTAGYGIHCISYYGGMEPSFNIFRYNIFLDNGQVLSTNAASAILLSGVSNQAYRNLIARSQSAGMDGYGIDANYGAANPKIFLNTIYSNYGGIHVGPTVSGAEVKNNIIVNSTNAANLVDEGSATIFAKNLCFGTGGTAHADFTSDPLFTNAGGDDYTLQAGSPAIDVGEVLSGISYTASLPDLGAFEFGADDLPDVTIDPIPPQPPTGGGTIDYDSDGDTVDIPGVGEGLPPSGSVPLPPGQTLITVIAYNENGSSIVTQQVQTFAGGLTYRAAAGYAPRSIKGGADLSVDNSELVGIMANKAIANQFGFLIKGVLTDEDIEVGRFDNARDELFLVNYEDLSMGKYFLPSSGSIGQIKSKRGTFESETRGKQYFLQQTFGDLISKLCRARLGDDVGDGTGEHDYKKQRFGCKVRIDPPFWHPETAYTVRPENDAALGSVVKPNIYNGRHFECVLAGTSGLYTSFPSSEPIWNLPVGSTTTDGGVTWQAILALEVFGSVTGTINRRFFQDSGRYEPPTTGIGINTGIAQYAIVNANVISSYFEIEGGDLTRVFLPSTTFAVTGSIANDGTYTVTVSTLIDGRTRIAVVETIPDDRAGGSIGAPNALASGFFTNGLLTFLTGLNTGITMEIKEFTLGQYPVVDVDQGAFQFMLDGDVTAQFVEGQRLAVAGSTGNDTEYNVVAVSYNIGTDQTEITVGSAIADATADGNILAGPGQFELFERMPFEIALGDEYVASAGCDLSKAMCKFKFRNIYNRRAEDETPGTDVALLTPDRPQ